MVARAAGVSVYPLVSVAAPSFPYRAPVKRRDAVKAARIWRCAMRQVVPVDQASYENLPLPEESTMPFLCKLGSHDWKKVHLNLKSCEVQEKCAHCGVVKEDIEVLHEWEWVSRNPCRNEQVCKRCGVVRGVDVKEHQWKKIYKPSSYEIQKTCERCGITQLQPSAFSMFVGQEDVKRSLVTLIATAHREARPLDHVLLCGQSGMGKTTLAKTIATEMGVGVKIILGQSLEKASDVAAILTNMRAGDILIVEQIESMRRQVADVLVPAIADCKIGIVIGKGPSAREITLRLPQFTVIGTTTNVGQIDRRLRNLMFVFNLAPYDAVEVSEIIASSVTQQGAEIEPAAISLLAAKCNGCPGEALMVFNKSQKYARVYTDGRITTAVIERMLAEFGQESDLSGFERQVIPDDVKIFVWQRDGGRCVKCGSNERLEYDHIIPVAKGGSNTARNIQLLCETCNRSKGA
jgi:Holliday junction DNA helicase RuvB